MLFGLFSCDNDDFFVKDFTFSLIFDSRMSYLIGFLFCNEGSEEWFDIACSDYDALL